MVKKKQIETEVEEKYTTTVRYHCPVRGWVEEEVQGVRFKPQKRIDNTVYKYSFIDQKDTDTDE